MKKMKMLKRTVLIVLSVLLLACTLVSCGSSEVALDTEYEGNSVDFYLAKLLMQRDDARAKFMAAANGYNMTEGFDDTKVGTAEDPKDPARVTYESKNEAGEVVKTYEVSIAGAQTALNGVKPAETAVADLEAFNKFYAELDAEDVVKTVELMQKKTAIVADEGGIFDTLLVWIGKFLGLLTVLTGGYYVWALFFFAIVVEVVLLYFAVKQQKTSIKQAKLRPKEMAIRKKYAGRNDQKSQQALQQELQRFYQEEGVSPFGGCLPLLIQMPIIIALYNIVIDPLHYVLGFNSGVSEAVQRYVVTPRAAGGLGDVLSSGRGTIEVISKDLSNFGNFGWYNNAADFAVDGLGDQVNFSLFGLNSGLTPSFTPTESINYLLLLIPVLTFVAYFFSMKLNRKFSYQPQMMAQNSQAGCSNNMMDIMMPLMSVYITFIMPAAVGIYWIFKCIIGVVKQFVLHKLMPLPVFTEEDYKRAEREMKGKLRPEERAPMPGRPAGAKRSLHSIDDEDDLPARVRPKDDDEEDDTIYDRRAREKAAQKLAAQTPDEKGMSGKFDGAKLKDDRKNNKKK